MQIAIIAEVNNGGALVEATVRMVDPNVSYRAVHASRGKAVRADPLRRFEQRRVHHVGTFPMLEDQMAAFTSDFDRGRAVPPDHVDALVWALTELWLNRSPVASSNGPALRPKRSENNSIPTTRPISSPFLPQMAALTST